MATITEENRKTLRPAVNVYCGLREMADKPTSLTPLSGLNNYRGIANIDDSLFPAVIMDLAGNGFRNDGEAIPMEPDTDSYRYGYISREVAKSDGTFNSKPGVYIVAGQKPQYVTLELRGQYGDSKTVIVQPTWPQYGTHISVYVDNWTPGERVYIVGVYLGKAWIWDDASLLSVSADLHGINTEIGGELEVSTIEIQAYETEDSTGIIGRIPLGAPIWYSSGYPGDMAKTRHFYLSDAITWDNNILTVKGQDASGLIDNTEVPVVAMNYGAGFWVEDIITDRIKSALNDITVEELGSPKANYLTDPQVILYETTTARSIISQFTGILRDPDVLRITYVDAGRPTINYGDTPTWTIYADEIADLNIIVERNKNKIELVIPEYYLQYNAEIEQVEATAGKTYFVELDPPIPVNNVSITPTPTSYEQINSSLFKFTAAANTTYTIKGYQTLSNLTAANDPYSVNNSEIGETYRFDFTLPQFITTGNVSVTKESLPMLLDRSNIVYEFEYRGNPHIQPRDVLNVEIATWEDDERSYSDLYPDIDLFPAFTLFPGGYYTPGRIIVRTWETMTVDAVTLEHSEGGGLTSKIKARKGAV